MAEGEERRQEAERRRRLAAGGEGDEGEVDPGIRQDTADTAG
jgi:hypothetical protein